MLKRINIKYFTLAVGHDRIGKQSDVGIAARCPVCGDSKTRKNAKRLHLYSKSNADSDFVTCFNGDCPVQTKTVYSFLRDFFPSLLENYKRENFSNTLQSLSSDDVFSSIKQNKTTETADVLVQDLSQFMKDISDVSSALEYLKNRGFIYNEDKYGKWYFGYQDLKIGETLYKITNSIVIPLYYRNEMYGFYSRSILDKKFYTYMHDANIGYKLWNWFNVDKNKPVYIFEGIFDAISSGLDAIAMMGAKIPDDRLKELKNPIFVLDNDKTGLKNSLHYAKLGYNVYVQPESISGKDMNEIALSGIDTKSLILDNIHAGISAEIRIKSKL